MEPEGSLLHSQASATCPYPGPAQSVHIPTSHLMEIHPNIIHPSTPRSPQWSLSFRFPHQGPICLLSSPIRATCPAHLILLDFVTRTILGEQYRSSPSRKHLLITLLRLEVVVLVLCFPIYLYLCSFNYSLFFVVYSLVFFSVCEGSLGLSILVSMIRSHGNDYFQSIFNSVP